MLADTANLRIEIDEIKQKVANQDKNIELVFSYLDELLTNKEEQSERRRIGFKPTNENV
jgi:hypothetical protein